MAGIGKSAKKLGMRAAERVMQNERAMSALMQLVTRAQKGKASFDKLQDGLLHAMGFAARGDYKALGKRISKLRRTARELGERLDSRAS
ncbi:MAG: hypothetical protein ACYCWW_01785 [Deltaproteobacteria bacterium]